MQIKLFDSELKVMELLWQNGELSAKKIAELLKEQIQWSKTTTYTVIKKCIEKDAIMRIEPGFVCRPLIGIEDVRKERTQELLNRMWWFQGFANRLTDYGYGLDAGREGAVKTSD